MTIPGFALGAGAMLGHDMLLPHTRFGHKEEGVDHKTLAAGTMLALGITIHNIPEGIAVGAGFLHASTFGIAIAMHNIPEGIATGLPLYIGSKSRRKVLEYTFLSGSPNPLARSLPRCS